MSNEMMKRECRKQYRQGSGRPRAFTQASDKLGSARNWGIFDMLGGGFISDFVKHPK